MEKLVSKTLFITGGQFGIAKAFTIESTKEGDNIAIADLKSGNSDKSVNLNKVYTKNI